MIFGKYINRYYLKNAPALLLGLLSLLIVDIAQLMVPELSRLVINGVNLGKVVVDGQTLTFTECHMEFGKPAPEAEATPEPTQKPTETTGYSELKQGSRGDAVTKLQKRLTELGYDCGKADGIYGSRTSRAVRFFQDALGVSQTGRASGEMQQKLFSANAPEYVHYVLLKKGSSGVRVEDLQARLRKLGYRRVYDVGSMVGWPYGSM